ncbi:hypothetical protein CK203_093782 [Vitis vinifera]|uniref:Reverse transcriptase Ty1/copia-type domain-containing protein n=1 Tax=Vitis vinifera TaxID=29760 RepID=A0A438C7U9_VITVI|nr:hypothetical protein CK203_093782 [Vitis vinifera]
MLLLVSKSTTLFVYVDDIILTRNDVEEMKMIKLKLAKEFKIKDLDSLRFFFGIEVARSKKGVLHSQVLEAYSRQRTKHVEIDQHFIKEKINEGVIYTPFIASKSKLADMFTKALPLNIYSLLIDKLGMLDIFELA